MDDTIDWCFATTVENVPSDAGLRVDVEGVPIAIFHIDEKYCATHDTCTHGRASLAEGYLEGEEVECPLHQGRYHIPTGKALCRPLKIDIKVFPIKVEGDQIFVGLCDEDLANEEVAK